MQTTPSTQWIVTHGVWLPEIDAEHKDLFERVEQIHAMMLDGATLAAAEPFLRELVKQLSAHLAHEEKDMRAVHYPMFTWHRKQHDTARRTVDELVLRVGEGDREAVAPAMEVVGRWMRDHIAVADRMMGAYLRNQRRTRRFEA